MSWSYLRAQSRIAGFVADAPKVVVERFDDGLTPRLRALQERRGIARDTERPLYDLPEGVAVLADTVQVYVNLTNYDDMRVEGGSETERSHARALAFLHLHYAALDRVVEEVGAQRVDFHGARLHAVIAEPSGPDGAQERVAKGLSLALEMTALAEAANRTIFGGDYVGKFRIGIDAGMCVAIDSGRHDEREPLFVGSAANHAAKLAEGTEPGIYLSPRVREMFGFAHSGARLNEVPAALEGELASVLRLDSRTGGSADIRNADTRRRAASWEQEVREHRANTATATDFEFHKHRLPLSSIDYQSLMPSKSIRMAMVSLFADIDGYTNYVDSAVSNNAVADAVRNLHVIRSELNAVLQDDFEGRKVRFVGDCIHGVVAEGAGTDVDEKSSVDVAAQCAGALRSSFDLCRQALPGIHQLGIAIGFELGETPISRIGIRGDRSVRVASSRATINSEACQRLCAGDQTMIGETAFAAASHAVRALFPGQVATSLDFDDVVFQEPGSMASASVVEPVGHERSHA